MKNLVIIIVVLLVIGAGAFFILSQQSQKQATSPTPTAAEHQMETEKESPTATAPSDASPEPSGAMKEQTSGNVKEFTVEGKNFSFSPSTITVNKGDTVKITFKNVGGMHDFRIDEFNVATKQIKDGEEDTVEFTADKAGSFEYYCSVGKHRQMGMVGTLVVK